MAENLATRLVNSVEKLYIENLLLKSMLKRANVPHWEGKLVTLLANPDPAVVAHIRAQFDPVRARIQEEANLEQVLQEFLRVAPPKKDVN